MQLYHFVLVFFSHCGVRLKKWISAVYLTKHAWNIQPSVFNSFHMNLIHGESHKFWQGPFSTLELSKDPPKNKQDFNSSVIRHFSASEKVPSFGDRITFFSQWKALMIILKQNLDFNSIIYKYFFLLMVTSFFIFEPTSNNPPKK